MYYFMVCSIWYLTGFWKDRELSPHVSLSSHEMHDSSERGILATPGSSFIDELFQKDLCIRKQETFHFVGHADIYRFAVFSLTVNGTGKSQLPYVYGQLEPSYCLLLPFGLSSIWDLTIVNKLQHY